MLAYVLIIGFLLLYFAIQDVWLKIRNWQLLILAFATGVVVALIAAVLQTIPSEFIPAFYASPIRIILIAPLIEEALKFCGSLAYVRKRRLAESESKQYGYVVGLSFGVFETFMRALLGDPFIGILLRVIATTPMHIATALISAYGFSHSLASGKAYRSFFYLGLAVTIHILFNGIALGVQPFLRS